MGYTYYPCTRYLESIEKAVLSQLGITEGKERSPADKEGDGSRESSEEAWHGWKGQDGHLWWRIFTDQSGKVIGSEILASFNPKEFRLYPINVQSYWRYLRRKVEKSNLSFKTELWWWEGRVALRSVRPPIIRKILE